MNFKIALKIFLTILFGIISSNTYSQDENHNHDHHRNELGVANSLVYFAKEKEVAYGFHLHLIRHIEHSKFGFGIDYERIFDEHKHNTVGFVGSYNPLESLHISLSPGITFEDKELSELKFAFHTEASYGFNLRNFHVGPVIGYAFDPEDNHFSLGLHIGYGF